MMLSSFIYALPFAPLRGLRQRAQARTERKTTEAYLQEILAELRPLS